MPLLDIRPARLCDALVIWVGYPELVGYPVAMWHHVATASIFKIVLLRYLCSLLITESKNRQSSVFPSWEKCQLRASRQSRPLNTSVQTLFMQITVGDCLWAKITPYWPTRPTKRNAVVNGGRRAKKMTDDWRTPHVLTHARLKNLETFATTCVRPSLLVFRMYVCLIIMPAPPTTKFLLWRTTTRTLRQVCCCCCKLLKQRLCIDNCHDETSYAQYNEK